MKILLANKFYYRRGGDCIYRGHKTKRIFKREPENDGRT